MEVISAEERLRLLLEELSSEFPRLKILPKSEVWHQRWIDVLLRALTFGAQKAFLTHYTTTLGTSRIYTPSDWESYSAAQRYTILRHERAHLRQFRRYGLPLMALLYVFLPFPFGVSYFRMLFEKEGYQETIRASKEVYGRDYVQRAEFQAWIVQQFTSGAYGWMWPFPKSVLRWVRATAEE